MAWLCRILIFVFVLSVSNCFRRKQPSPFTPGWWYRFQVNDNLACPMFESYNAKIGLWNSCDDDIDHSLWKVVQGNETGTFTLVNQKSHLCMTVGIDMQDTGNNTPVVQYECQTPTSANQLWSYQVISRDDKKFVLLKSGDRCISNHNLEPGTSFYMFDCDATIDQLIQIN